MRGVGASVVNRCPKVTGMVDAFLQRWTLFARLTLLGWGALVAYSLASQAWSGALIALLGFGATVLIIAAVRSRSRRHQYSD